MTITAESVSFPQLTDYSFQGILYQGPRTTVYRAVETATQQSVVIKVLAQEYPSFAELVQFRNQYMVAKNLPISGIVRPLGLKPWGNGYALVMEDFGGIDLGQYAQQNALNLTEFLDIAIQLADMLHELHQHRVIHKDIKPANILIHPESKQVKLIDFSIASLLPKENQAIQSPKNLEGTLAYLAPEQTGRMNRAIDYRTDFYTLGATLYQLLTGQLPFKGNDPLELIHCHIAKIPVSPCEVGVPNSLSDIVLKLMAKNAEDRYQSALGLKHDLEQCLAQWQEQGTINDFVLGQRDLSDRFTIPEKLYGRETEVQTLLDAFDRVSQGAAELMLVAGYSGVGKTAVVNEVHKPIVAKRGYFVKGKFDQFNRNIPFSAVVQAFRDLMGQLLGESDAQLQKWQAQILATIGDNGQVLIDVIPELEAIIGPQPPVPELSGSAAQNRFNRLFEQFIAVFTTPDHPLVMFLDDLQWADSASLNLLDVLMGDTQTGYLLLLGAYRDNEVSPAHPLMLTLGELEKQATTLATITLAPLSSAHINQFVAETLSCTLASATPFTDLVYQKTKGNPFFTTQFLKGLHEDGLITLDRQVGSWECDLVQVKAAALTDDVVQFMAGRLHKLPQATQKLLKLAACIGNQFDLESLAIICKSTSVEVADDLWSALQSGLILPQSEAYKFFQGREAQGHTQSISVSYHFLHDRVQQAAYALIEEEQKQMTHLNIGRFLLQKISLEEREKNLFQIVNQLNMGISLIEQTKEIEALAELNLRAAQKAKSAAAYDASASYLNTAIALLHAEAISTEPWHSHYGLMLPLCNLLAEVSYLNGEYEVSQQQTQTVIDHAQDLLDQVKAYEIRILLSVAQGQCQRALEVGLEILSLLDVSLDDAPLANIDIDHLYQLPAITNPRIIAALSILSKLWAPAQIASSDLLPQVTVTMLNLSVTHGNSAIAAFAYSLYGMLLCAKMTDIELGYRFGQLALHTLERYEDADLTCKVSSLFYAFIRNWKELARDRVEGMADNVQIGLETGDIEFACYAGINYCDNLLLMGESLNTLHHKQTYYIELAKNLQQSIQHGDLSGWGQMVENLMGMAVDPTRLVGNRFDESIQIPKLQAIGIDSSLFFIYTAKTILSYLFEDYEQTLIHSQSAIQHEQGGAGMLPSTQIPLYCSLGILALYSDVDPEGQIQSLDEVEAHQQRLRVWATHAPMNYQHKVDLIEAEKCRVLGQKLKALERYDRAIAGAKQNKFIQEEALANELASKFYLDWGKEKVAAGYMQEAYYCYSRWGAKAKTDDLEQRYPRLLAPIFQQAQLNSILKITHTTTPTLSRVTTRVDGTLDSASLMKAARTLSQGINRDLTITNLMHVIQENAGAETVALMLFQNGSLSLEAQLINGQINLLEGVSVNNTQAVPLAIINTVKRGNTALIVADARTETNYLQDAYIQAHQPRSILCLPLSDHGQQVGILYLENNQCSGAFTENRVETLTLLCAQAAIALENARLYQQVETYSHTLEAEVERKTQDLNQKNKDLEQALHELKQTQAQLIQTEKMSSLGQMVAGVAHEINNPISFIKGNLEPLEGYLEDLKELLALYEKEYPQPHASVQARQQEIDLDFLFEDVTAILRSMDTGSDRIQNIVLSLHTFARLGESSRKTVDIHKGIDSTLLLVHHRLSGTGKLPEIEIITDYGDIPSITCYPSQLNQVFLNIINNAIDAIRGNPDCSQHPEIRIQTMALEEKQARISISNSDSTIPQDIQKNIFDPFFTTKSVGEGKGLGLFVSYSIVQKHRGTLTVCSQPGDGVNFEITLPYG